MQKFRIITVEDKHLSVSPNLENHERAYRDFDLKGWVRGEVEYFDDGKLNAAYNAIERHSQNFRKNDFIAVNRVYLEIQNGELFSLLGHNGAGKTTLINMMIG